MRNLGPPHLRSDLLPVVHHRPGGRAHEAHEAHAHEVQDERVGVNDAASENENNEVNTHTVEAQTGERRMGPVKGRSDGDDERDEGEGSRGGAGGQRRAKKRLYRRDHDERGQAEMAVGDPESSGQARGGGYSARRGAGRGSAVQWSACACA